MEKDKNIWTVYHFENNCEHQKNIYHSPTTDLSKLENGEIYN